MDVDFTGPDGSTPLGRAARAGHMDILKVLIEKCGAALDLRDKDGIIPLAWALATANNRLVELLIGKGAELNTEDNKHRTPLMRARALARHCDEQGDGCEEIVELIPNSRTD